MARETKYTPGKWEISNRSEYTVVQSGLNRSIATTGGYSDNQRSEAVEIENKANARLIAEAPTLLSNLEVSTAIMESIIHLFGDSMAMSTRFGLTSQIESNKELIKKIEG